MNHFHSQNIRLVVLTLLGVVLVAGGCHHKPKPYTTSRSTQPPKPNIPTYGERPPTPPARPSQPPIAGEPRWYPPGGISNRWTTVVVHHSATGTGSAKSFDRAHRDKGWDELGYHFVIGNGTSTPDGFIEVGSRWFTQKHGAHCKTPDNYFNEHGIGICLVGDFTKTRPSPKQMASLQRLVAFLCDQCRIPESRVTTHGMVTHKTQCPGRNFPIMSLRRALVMGNSERRYAQ